MILSAEIHAYLLVGNNFSKWPMNLVGNGSLFGFWDWIGAVILLWFLFFYFSHLEKKSLIITKYALFQCLTEHNNKKLKNNFLEISHLRSAEKVPSSFLETVLRNKDYLWWMNSYVSSSSHLMIIKQNPKSGQANIGTDKWGPIKGMRERGSGNPATEKFVDKRPYPPPPPHSVDKKCVKNWTKKHFCGKI